VRAHVLDRIQLTAAANDGDGRVVDDHRKGALLRDVVKRRGRARTRSPVASDLTFHQARSPGRPTTASRRVLPCDPECVGRLRLERSRATGSRHPSWFAWPLRNAVGSIATSFLIAGLSDHFCEPAGGTRDA
jgi:hypothetical protein